MTASHGEAQPLRGKKIILGVSGGIAAYKAVELCRLLTKEETSVQVVMTERARHFVGELTFQTLTGHLVFADLFSLTQESEIGHIQVADGADLVVIAPATANTIGKMAAGLADDALTAVALATRAPILVAPSMNVNMWDHPQTQANVRRLVEAHGVRTVGPGSGFLACQWTGPGRLAEPEDIVEAAVRILSRQDLAGRRIVVSAGPTREAIDPVRFLSNRSTGKMGYAIALAAVRRGADVHLVTGPTSLPAPLGVGIEPVTTAAEMFAATRAAAAGADVVVMAAAVADCRPRRVAERKTKKAQMGSAPVIELEPTADILAALGAERRAQARARPLLIGFAAETDSVLANARAKLEAKGCDLVVANDVSEAGAGFAVDTNRVIFVQRDQEQPLGLASKLDVAHALLNRVVALLR